MSRKRCPYGPTSEDDAAALRAAKEKRFLDERLAHLMWGQKVLTAAKATALGALALASVAFVALPSDRVSRRTALGALASVALIALPSDRAEAWFPHGTASGPPPMTPQWPVALGGYTNYWVADPSAGGNDTTNTGTSMSSPWATVSKVNTALAGATGNVAVNFLSTFTYQCPLNGAVLTPSGTTNFAYRGLVGATTPPIISANGVASNLGMVRTGSGVLLEGISFQGNSNSYGVVTGGSGLEISHCWVQSFPVAGGGGIAIVVQNTNTNIHDSVIGGLSPTDETSVGVVYTIVSGSVLKNNTIGYCGGNQSNPLQYGFGVHTTDTTLIGVPGFTYSAGVPTNALLEIAFNIVHDCGGNLTSTTGGGPSGIELGGGNRLWCHDNIVYNIQSVSSFTGGTDFDPIDCGDTYGTTLTERNLCYNCYGGLIDFGDANSGPIICRYNLVVNCGTSNDIFAGAVQGEGTNTIHQWYGNTFVTMALNGNPAPIEIFIGAGLSSATGFFANNLVYVTYPWKIFDTDGLSSTVSLTTNCWFSGAAQVNGRLYDFGGVSTYTSYAAAKAAQSLFDQNGVTGDPKLANAISTATWSGGQITIGTAVPHGQTGTFQVTIDGNSYWNGSVYNITANGTFTATVVDSTHFTYPLASDPTGPGLASPGVWAIGAVSGLYNANSYKINSSSSCYRTGVNVATMFGVNAGSTDFYGNPINPALASIGCHQP